MQLTINSLKKKWNTSIDYVKINLYTYNMVRGYL